MTRSGDNKRAWQVFRAAGKIDCVDAVASGIAGRGNTHPGGLHGFIATPIRPANAGGDCGVAAARIDLNRLTTNGT